MSLLDAGALPIVDLARIGAREGIRPRPIYQAHRWFARRFGSAFRAILVAAQLNEDDDFWRAYYEGVSWQGKTVLDPFVGGGTSVIEAQRLGANIIGMDVDAVACAIARFEARLEAVPDLIPALDALKADVGQELSEYYRTVTPLGQIRTVLHFFWVQVVRCRGCDQLIEAHPNYRLAYEAEGNTQWAFCPACHHVAELSRSEGELHCDRCQTSVLISEGPVHYGTLTCPHCGTSERLIDVAERTKRPPDWRLFALETLDPAAEGRTVPMVHRHFQGVTEYDQLLYQSATTALAEKQNANREVSSLEESLIPSIKRSDDRLLRYGYRDYKQLFNDRQLLHLSLLASAIKELSGDVKQPLGMAFSNHLATNCMMTHYAQGWRRLAPLFSIRAYRHIVRPVEINPWLDGTGRGTFPNAVRQVQKAAQWVKAPRERLVEGGFRRVSSRPTGAGEPEQRVKVVQGDAKELVGVGDGTVDLVLTDPPYFDNIAYSELSDFYLPWMQLVGLVSRTESADLGYTNNLAARSRGKEAADHFASGLGQCFREIHRVLKDTGRLVFTYQHQTAEAWLALANALSGSGLKPVQVFPMLGDGSQAAGRTRISIRWDSVFVFTKDTDQTRSDLYLSHWRVEQARTHYQNWIGYLDDHPKVRFGERDRQSFGRACLVGSALGLFSTSECSEVSASLDLASQLTLTPLFQVEE